MPTETAGLRILITGGAGFIGSHFSERMISRGHAVTALDNFNDYYDPAVKRRNVQALTKLGPDAYRLIEPILTTTTQGERSV